MRSRPLRPIRGTHAARALLGRARTALDECDAALADFHAALELARSADGPAGGGPVAVPAHQALHNLEQLTYLEQVDNLAPGTLLPVPAGLREVAQRKLNQVLEGAGGEIPALPMGGQCSASSTRCSRAPAARSRRFPWAANTAECWPIRRLCCTTNRRPPAVSTRATIGAMSSMPSKSRIEAPPARPAADAGTPGRVAALLPAVDRWRRPYPPGYIGANPESGFFSSHLLQIAAELGQAVPELLGELHLNYWWSFVCQHQRPGVDIHADHSDISLNFWITPDPANLQPGGGGLDVWDVAAPADWSFDDYNSGYPGHSRLPAAGRSAADPVRLRREQGVAVQRHDLPPDRSHPVQRGLRELPAQRDHAVPTHAQRD